MRSPGFEPGFLVLIDYQRGRLMSWTRLSSNQDLDDDRTVPAATAPRLKALGASANFHAKRDFFVWSQERHHLVVEGSEKHALGDYSGDRLWLEVHDDHNSLAE